MSQATWKTLSSGVKTLITFGAIAIIALIIALIFLATKPDYGELYAGLDQTDAAAVVQELKELGIDYQLGDNGQTVMIDKNAINDTRLELSSKNTLSKNDVGLELFQDADYGMTEFAQRVNYQRAMQGELARTIMSLDAVKLARVHLTIAKEGLLISKKEPPKASITLITHEGEYLSDSQISGIVRLVAASVKDLSTDNVTIVNDQGELLSRSGESDNATLTQSQFEQKQQIEQQIKEKVSNLLLDLYAVNNFSVSVDATLDFNRKKEINNKILDSDKSIVANKKEKKSNSKEESNTANKKGSVNASSDNEVQYLHGSSREEIEYAVGTLKRLSLGVIVPDSFAKEQLPQLEEVIAAAVGLDKARGDTFKLAALPLTKTLADLKPVANSSTVMNENTDTAPTSMVNVEENDVLVDSQDTEQTAELPFASFTQQFDKGQMIYALIASIALVIVLLVILLVRSTKSPKIKRLSQEERQVALKEINQWLKQAS